MAKKIIHEAVTKISLTGEQQYTNAIKKLKAQQKGLTTEGKLLNAQYKNNALSISGLIAKNKNAIEQFKTSNASIKAYKERLKELKDKGVDPLSPSFLRVQRDMTTAFNTRNAVINNFKNNFNSKIIKPITKGLKAGSVALLSFAGIGAKIGKDVFSNVYKASEFADNLLTQSQVTRLSTKELQEYDYALKFIDGDMNTLTGAMKRNIKSVGSVAEGNKQLKNIYKELGIELLESNGKYKSNKDIFWETIDALKNIDDETKRDIYAQKLLGKSASELNPIINAGSQAFRNYASEASKLGLVMDEGELAKLGKYNDEIQRLTATRKSIARNLGALALPSINDISKNVLNIFLKANEAIKKTAKDPKTSSENIKAFSEYAGNILAKGFTNIANKLPQITDGLVNTLKSAFQGIVKHKSKIIKSAGDIIGTLAKGFVDLLPEGIPIILEGLAEIAGTILSHLPELFINVLKGTGQGIINVGKKLLGITDGQLSQFDSVINSYNDDFKSFKKELRGIDEELDTIGKTSLYKAKSIETLANKIDTLLNKKIISDSDKSEIRATLVQLEALTGKNYSLNLDNVKTAQKEWQGYKEQITATIDELLRHNYITALNSKVQKLIEAKLILQDNIDDIKSKLENEELVVKNVKYEAGELLNYETPTQFLVEGASKLSNTMLEALNEKLSGYLIDNNDSQGKLSNNGENNAQLIYANYDAINNVIKSMIDGYQAQITNAENNYKALNESYTSLNAELDKINEDIKNTSETQVEISNAKKEELEGIIDGTIKQREEQRKLEEANSQVNSEINNISSSISNLASTITSKASEIASIKISKPKFYTHGVNPRFMASGGIFQRATLFSNANTVVGEAGAEAVIPLNKLWKEMDKRYKNNSFNVTQNIYADNTDYYQQQRRASIELKKLMWELEND